MSKKSVWNKGKHNGGAGSKLSYKNQVPAIKKLVDDNAEIKVEKIDIHNPVNIVKRMNRDNWVERPARVIRNETAKATTNNADKN